MSQSLLLALIAIGLHLIIVTALAVRILLRPHRDPVSRVAWLVVIFSMPVLGLWVYLLFGEVNIGREALARRQRLRADLPAPASLPGFSRVGDPTLAESLAPIFRFGQTISGLPPVAGNQGYLLADSNASIAAMVADIDAAQQQVHVLFYIWLADNNGLQVVEALKRAALRGVSCRAMADALGSRQMIRSKHWRAMRAAGVHLAQALPLGRYLPQPLKARLDLRNHRKLVIIDNAITYFGSQNCADPEFRVKARFAPWVDVMLRCQGPLALQHQYLFVLDWMAQVDEDLTELLRQPAQFQAEGFVAQAVGTGPMQSFAAMPQLFETLIFSARRELIISTPYYVPDEAMQAALCACARRGVATTLIVPARNDSWVVAAASRSYYWELLSAGVQIHEFVGGLLHAKTLTVDSELTMLGSANMDRRSFDLNYESVVLLADHAMTAEVRERQQRYLASTRLVALAEVMSWSRRRRLWNNTIAMLGPIL